MGNSSTKEARPPSSPSPRQSAFRLPLSPPSPTSNPPQGQSFDRTTLSMHSSRPARSSRPDITFLGLGGNSDRSDTTVLETRRETKQEREARKLERERAARLKERERSMREEGVDGGYLVTQGVYVGTEDFSKPVVRQLMIERRVAPFWKGLNDFSESWTEHQLVAAARGLPIPAPDEIPPEDQYRRSPSNVDEPHHSEKNLKNLTVPISSRSQSYNSDSSTNLSPSYPAYSLPSPSSPLSSPTSSSSPLFRGRSKTLASLTTSSKNNSQQDMTPRELQLPKDPFVNGQPVEAYLYKDAAECPICFIYYPPYLNKTRCCDQPICSECFVQIKRPDPHPPEHEVNDPNAPPTPSTGQEAEADGQLVSEPAACPFCVQPEFGITYSPPPFKRGLTYATAAGSHPLAHASSAMSSSSSLGSSPGAGSRRRATSLSANAPSVITTDRIRPDWATKLASARAHAARRSAAATALHTAAYLMNSRDGPDPRAFGPFSRRGVLRRVPGGPDSPGGTSSASHLNALALLAERHGPAARNENGPFSEGEQPPATFLAPPRGSSSRRSRIDDLEDMMMMEAIRLSLAAEEERRKKEEKEAKKEAKKKEKEAKKAEKAARKAGVYQQNANQSNSGLDSSIWRPESGASSIYGESLSIPGKGKAVDRETGANGGQSVDGDQSPSTSIPGISLSGPQKSDSLPMSTPPVPIMSTSSAPKPSHLRHMSNASSSASSYVESAPSSLKNVLSGSTSSFDGSPNGQPDGMRSSTPPGGSAGLEPMFNFQSLAAMIGDEEKAENPSHVEHTPSHQGQDSEDLIDFSEPISTPAGYSGGPPNDKTPAVESKESELHHNGMPTGNASAAAS